PAAAAQEHGDRVLGYALLQLLEKALVRTHPGVALPFDLDRTGHASDEVPLGARANIDQYGFGVLLQQLVRFRRGQRAVIGQSVVLRALAGLGKDLVASSHSL